MPTPFDDLRCVDCDHLWSAHAHIPDDPGLHFVMDNSTAEEVWQHLVGLTAERDALKVEVENLRAELAEVRQRFIVRLEPGVWLAAWEGEPGWTTFFENARQFAKEVNAQEALRHARRFRPFPDAVVERVT